MANIRDMQSNQAIIRSEMDQLKSQCWQILHQRGEEWTDRFDQMITAFMQHDQDPWRSLGLLAQIGFLHLLESWDSFEVSQDPTA
jgi:hypothetical protein